MKVSYEFHMNATYETLMNPSRTLHNERSYEFHIKFIMEASYKFSYEIHKNFSYEFHMNNEKAPYEFDMKFMTCVCWDNVVTTMALPTSR